MENQYEAEFGICEVCGGTEWQVVYAGPIRKAIGQRKMAAVAECGKCHVHKLDIASQEDEAFYENNEYRKELGQKSSDDFMAIHDIHQSQHLAKLWPLELRGKVVADVGCSAGSLLDHIKSLTADAVAVEPCEAFHEELMRKGYSTYSYTKEAVEHYGGLCDVVFCMDTIEHVADPVELLKDMAELLAPGGRLIVVTPNRDEILMKVLPDIYLPHNYRTVHTWYFNQASLKNCTDIAGLQVEKGLCLHRWGISNFLFWVQGRGPMGHTPMLASHVIDTFWQSYLEENWLGENICFILTKEGKPDARES